MKRQTMAAVAALLVVSGCSGHASTPAAKVTVGGQDQPTGPVSCANRNGSAVITIGDADTGVVATLTDADAPKLLSVVFGDVGGRRFMYIEDMPVSGAVTEPKATKDGKHYTLAGTASELEAVANPESRPFAIDATCP